MFKFNFNEDGNSPVNKISDDKKNVLIKEKAVEVSNILKEGELKELDVVKHVYGSTEIILVNPRFIEQTLCNKSKEKSTEIVDAVSQQCDLVQGVYEGGFKVWECGIDLVNFLQKLSIQFDEKNVLELGCGAGLPGIYAMLNEAPVVDFQDYNKDVLEKFTIPNVYLNQLNKKKCRCRFVAGDWSGVSDILHDIKYDYILSAETIYNTDNYSSLVELFHKLLKPDGIIYIAAKSNYYGVGGGTKQFQQFLSDNGVFHSDVVEVINAGVPREILEVERKKKVIS